MRLSRKVEVPHIQVRAQLKIEQLQVSSVYLYELANFSLANLHSTKA